MQEPSCDRLRTSCLGGGMHEWIKESNGGFETARGSFLCESTHVAQLQHAL